MVTGEEFKEEKRRSGAERRDTHTHTHTTYLCSELEVFCHVGLCSVTTVPAVLKFDL